MMISEYSLVLNTFKAIPYGTAILAAWFIYNFC